jgi:hypothetical protein
VTVTIVPAAPELCSAALPAEATSDDGRVGVLPEEIVPRGVELDGSDDDTPAVLLVKDVGWAELSTETVSVRVPFTVVIVVFSLPDGGNVPFAEV